MYTLLRVWLAARKLGLRDRGVVGDGTRWSAVQKRTVTFMTVHHFCRTPIRVGILKKTGERVLWCYLCEDVLTGGGNDGGGSGDSLQPVPPDTGDPIPKEVIDEAQKVLDRISSR